MSNQHSLIALDWLMPVLQDVFDELIDLLQPRTETDVPTDWVAVGQALHQVAGALTLARQSQLASLTKVLEQACAAIMNEELSANYQSDIAQSVALLYYELRQLQQIQQLHVNWIVERTNFFRALLGEPPVTAHAEELVHNTTAMLSQLPPITHAIAATDRQDLQKMWRYHTLQLLASNHNQPESLGKMAEVAKFLATAELPDSYRHVWQLVALWASSQLLNDIPTPHQYNPLLDALDKLIVDENEPSLTTANVAINVLLQLAQLVNKTTEATNLLTPLHLQDSNKFETLFKKSLGKLEHAIYQLHEPEKILPNLEEIKHLLTNRGWLLYENQLNQIIADIQLMLQNPESAGMLSWQVERQLQDLYSQLLATADTLEAQIGTSQFHDTHNSQQAAVRQTRVHLENIKNAFNDYTQSHDSQNLAVNDDFVAMGQVFGTLGLEQPKHLAERLRLIFAKIVETPIAILSWAATDAVVGTIAQFELFLDYLSHHSLNNRLLEQTEDQLNLANSLINALAQNPLQQADLPPVHKVFAHNTPIYDDEGESLAVTLPQNQSQAHVNSQNLPTAQSPSIVNAVDDFDSFSLFDASKLPVTAVTASVALAAIDSADTTKPTSTATNLESATAKADVTGTATPSAPQTESELLLAARGLLKPDDDDADEEIREIFIEEAEEVLASLDDYLPRWQANPTDLGTLKDIRRGFHTLKGSGRMVGAFQLGETAWSVENMLNRVLDGTIDSTPELVAFIVHTREQIPTLIEDYAQKRVPSIDPALIILQATNLQNKRPLLDGMPLAVMSQPPAQVLAVPEHVISPSSPSAAPVTTDRVIFDDNIIFDDEPRVAEAATLQPVVAATQHPVLENATSPITAEPRPAAETQPQVADNLSALDTAPAAAILPPAIQTELNVMPWAEDGESDPDIQEIYIEEAHEVLEAILPEFAVWQKNPADLATLKELRRGFHTLKGSGRMVGANQLGELGWAIENMLNRVLDATIEPVAGLVALVGDVIHGFAPLIEIFAQNRHDYPEYIKVWAATANAYSKKHGEEFDYPAFLKVSNTSAQPISEVVSDTHTFDTHTNNDNATHPVAESHHTDHELAQNFVKDNDDTPLETHNPTSMTPVISDDAIFDNDDELVFEDDPSDAEDDNYVGKTASKSISGTWENTKTSAENDTTTANHLLNNASKTTSNGDIVQDDSADRLSDEDVIGHVFLEESTELLNKITQFIDAHRHDEQVYVSDDLVRAFHTLRGGAALSELPRVYALSTALENSLDELLRKEVPLTAEQIGLLEGAKDDLAGYIGDYKSAQSTTEQPSDAEEIAHLTSQLLEEVDDNRPTGLTVSQLIDLGIDDLVAGESQVRQQFSAITTEQNPAVNTTQIIIANTDPNNPSHPLLTEAAQSVPHSLIVYNQTMLQQAETLWSAVKDTKFAGLAEAFKFAYATVTTYPEFCHDEQVIEGFEALHDQLINVLDSIAAGMNITWNESAVTYLQLVLNEKIYQAQLAAVQYETASTDIELLDIFLDEALELDKRVHHTFTRWQSNLNNLAETRELQHALHTIKGGARMVGVHSIGDLCFAAENVYAALSDAQLPSNIEIANIMQQVQETIFAQLSLLKQEHRSFFAPALQAQLAAIVTAGKLPEGELTLAVPIIVAVQRNKADAMDTANNSTANATNNTNNVTGTDTTTSAQNLQNQRLQSTLLPKDAGYSQEIINNFEQRRLQTWQGQEPDEDILAVFLEEAKELIDSSSQHLQEFRSNTSDMAALQALQRELHTVKGGARMVGAEGLANLAHEMETIYEELGSRRKPATRMIGNLLAACHDWLASALFVLENKYNPQTPDTLIVALQQFSKNPDSLKTIPQASLAQQIEQIEIYQTSLIQAQEDKIRDLSVMPPMTGKFETEQEQNALTSEMIRVPATLMERMINLSGESAINRARIDMGITSLTNTIEEMGVTVQRLADQLRRMETELEVQVLAQIDDERLLDTDFDPLEMDQYSALNQLSKSLSESASDLLDIKTTMLDKTRDTENLLLQLSRTQTELQEGLMNSRMVPFSRVTPRLQRIVRQTANELNKSVELRVLNDDSEVDRTILDRITSPLEHMIRNAVDHGIERTQERIESGKPRTGTITLELVREGGEIVIYLTDDGKGVNVDAVRKKAVEQGLIAADDTSLKPLDIMQYIFNAGLSTSAAITQISGRGVGMDVVQSEVKQLGGVVSVDSEMGKGSRFILRLPLTVAVSDALVVKAGDKQFAVPLVQIERVVRISAESIHAFHESDAATFDIDGQPYRLRYLNQILYGTNPLESVRHQSASVPVIIIRNETGQKMALQVDALAGSRIEVVVKPMGRQLSHIAGISSATIMGDGSVMLILDLIALMRNATNAVKSEKSKAALNAIKPVVLIIDDSVTVRKVTSRLLERNGYEAQIAKDGVDALEVLQSLTPDIMLLDIEMPRMDGFEVANQVRHTPRLKDIPIIMITSRTGEKHRDRAMSIGVDEYMGKPFQEQELLENLTKLLAKKVS